MSKILKAVVMTNHINVINFMLWPFSCRNGPRQTMRYNLY